MKKSVWWIVLAVICAYTLAFVIPAFFERREEKLKKSVLTLWNVDSFEGGKGSRTAFLSSIAARYEKSAGIILLVSSKSVEGLKDAWEKGERPDMLSFGGYAPVAGLQGEAFCWCMGKYVLYTRGEEKPITPQNTVISVGGDTFPQAAAALYGLRGEIKEEESTTAYVRFLSGAYDYLLGTQRDACRFQSRGVEVCATALNGFCDLRQYIVTVTKENAEKSQDFIRYLLAEESQKLLKNIGMFSDRYTIYEGEGTLQGAIEEGKTIFSISPWTAKEQRMEISAAIKRVMQGENVEVLKNLLKGV